jgi:predicted PurR-regulated permease PerM
MAVTGKNLGQWLLLAVFAAILYFCFRIMQPFLLPAFLGIILSILLAPVHAQLASQLNERRSLAAVLVCVGLTLAILFPVLVLSFSFANEANDAYQRLRDPDTVSKIEAWLDPAANPILRQIRAWLPSSVRLDSIQLGAQAQRIGVALLGLATKFAEGIFNLVVNYLILVVVVFFLLRDSDHFGHRVRSISPLSDEQEEKFVQRLRIVARATVLGNLLTSLTQGTISGIAFLTLGLPNPILWGALTALLSLIPLVGTALVWVPWTIYLFVAGTPIKAVIFLAVQILVIGSVDNVIRPLFIRGGAKMHTLLIFFSILGGIAYFGIFGMFFGPVMFAIAIALLEFYVAPSEQELG